MAGETLLSVIIPTAQPRFIADTLDALARQTYSRLEVVVVENGARTNGLEQLVSSFANRMPIDYIYSPEAGINRARNIGIGASSGTLIALTDDDCVPASNWAERTVDIHQKFPDAGVVGGRIKLKLLAPGPPWLVGEFRRNLSEVNIADDVTEVRANQFVAGANLSFKRAVYSAVGGFCEDLGLSGRRPPQLVHDEKLFVRRARSRGRPGALYTPHAVVEHLIPSDRLQIEYHEHRRYGLGVSDVDYMYASNKHIDRDTVLRSFVRSVDNQRGALMHAHRRQRSMTEEDFREHLENLLRARIAYASGMQDRILERFQPGTIHATLANPELRYYNSGKKAVQKRLQPGMSRGDTLDLAVEMFVRDRYSHPAALIESHIRLIHNRIAFWKGIRDAFSLGESNTEPLTCRAVPGCSAK